MRSTCACAICWHACVNMYNHSCGPGAHLLVWQASQGGQHGGQVAAHVGVRAVVHVHVRHLRKGLQPQDWQPK